MFFPSKYGNFCTFFAKEPFVHFALDFFCHGCAKIRPKNKHCLENTLPICVIVCLFIALWSGPGNAYSFGCEIYEKENEHFAVLRVSGL
jgi:hypothetical protein